MAKRRSRKGDDDEYEGMVFMTRLVRLVALAASGLEFGGARSIDSAECFSNFRSDLAFMRERWPLFDEAVSKAQQDVRRFLVWAQPNVPSDSSHR